MCVCVCLYGYKASGLFFVLYETYASRLEAIQQTLLHFLDYKIKHFLSGYEHRCIRYRFLRLCVRQDINDVS